MFKKIVSILLLASMLSAAAACSDKGSSEPAETTSADTSETAEVTTADLRPDLPESDFEGYEFRSLSRGIDTGSSHWYIFDTAYIEDKAGDVVNDAVQTRNTFIEEEYNVKISIVGTSTYQETARSSILAGSDDFDIYGDSVSSASALAAEGFMVDYDELLYVDLDAPYWDQKAREGLSVAGKLYTMVSDFTLMDKHGTWITLFTKPMIDMYSLEDPYELVRSGKWTLDKMADMAKAVSHDVDGDGKLTEADSWGTIGEAWNVNALMVGAGVKMFEKNSDDIPESALGSERMYNAFEKAFGIIADSNITLWANKLAGTYSDIHIDGLAPAMESNRALFYITGMNRVVLLRGMETDFGILPNPKLDETQDDYNVIMTYGNTNSISVPITNSDLDRTSILLEALSYESSKTTYPAYIETTIKGKHARDEESIEMLELIFDNRAFDLGIIFNWGGCSSLYQNLVNSYNSDLASAIAANEASYVSKMQEMVELFESN